MKNLNKESMLNNIKVLILAALLGVGVNYLSAWTGAPTTGTAPTNCTTGYAGCDAPINVANTLQTKVGSLVLNTGSSPFATGLVVLNGNVGIGTSSPATALEVVNGPIKATGGLIIETRTTDPSSPQTGRMWLLQ
jgi:hypothetical protein